MATAGSEDLARRLVYEDRTHVEEDGLATGQPNTGAEPARPRGPTVEVAGLREVVDDRVVLDPEDACPAVAVGERPDRDSRKWRLENGVPFAMTSGDRHIRTRQRVTDHGEVFTPGELVDCMLDLVKAESERIDSRVLEPACGHGALLVPVLRRKLATVQARHGKSEFEKRHYALLAVMCIYGIELLADNVLECRQNLLDMFLTFLGSDKDGQWSKAARVVLEANIVEGDALTMTAVDGTPITFPEWGYLGKGKFQRRDFRYDNLAQRSSFEGSLWEGSAAHDIFTPARSYPAMTVREIAA